MLQESSLDLSLDMMGKYFTGDTDKNLVAVMFIQKGEAQIKIIIDLDELGLDINSTPRNILMQKINEQVEKHPLFLEKATDKIYYVFLKVKKKIM